MDLYWVWSTEINGKGSGEYRARSDCTYVQADLALHFLQNKSMVTKGQDKDETVTFHFHLSFMFDLKLVCCKIFYFSSQVGDQQ